MDSLPKIIKQFASENQKLRLKIKINQNPQSNRLPPLMMNLPPLNNPNPILDNYHIQKIINQITKPNQHSRSIQILTTLLVENRRLKQLITPIYNYIDKDSLKVWYGDTQRHQGKDVTNQVLSMIDKNNDLVLEASNEHFEDTLPGIIKVLSVKYNILGNKNRISVEKKIIQHSGDKLYFHIIEKPKNKKIRTNY